MIDQVRDDTQVMSLVKLALALPSEERASYLKSACSGNPELFDQVWNYVHAEERMKGFLLEPLYPAPPSDEFRFRPGDLLDGRFRIVREVAQGGMGVVYEAADERLERRIALKCAKVGYRKRLPPEVRNATEISHPNVCKIFEIHSTRTSSGEIDFVTMEFLDGETLAKRLRRGPLPEAEARAVALQLCAGLAEAHRHGVIHGDLKAANVILTTSADGERQAPCPRHGQRAVITDFGLAHCSEASLGAARLGAKGGTPGYMAPELWRGEDASVASDIYALGVILYEMVSGHKPHDPPRDLSQSALTTTMTPGPVQVVFWEERLTLPPPPLHSRWDSVLRRCLDPDPARRFRDMDEVIEALGPSRARLWFLAGAAALVLTAASGMITYKGAVAPKEVVRLAVLPFQADPGTGTLAASLLQDAATRIGGITSSARTKFTVIPIQDALRQKVETVDRAQILLHATHVLHGALAGSNGRTRLHAFLTDARTQVNTREWMVDYAPGELRFAPVALAGMVSETFRLPPPANGAAVNDAARADYQAGMIHVRKESEIDDAIGAFNRAVAADPDSALTYAGLAEAQWFKYATTDDKAWFQQASESVRQAEARNPDVAAVHRIVGLLKFDEGWYDQAAEEYRRAMELEPANSDAYRRLGQAKEWNSQLEEALASYQRAIELEPNYQRNYQALADFYTRRGQYSAAIPPLIKAAELVPKEPRVHYGLGANYQILGQFPEAERELRLAIQLKETSESLHALGGVLLYQRRFQEAIPHFVRALELNPLSYLSWMELGVCYRQAGKVSEAMQASRRGLEVVESEMAQNPRNGWYRSILAYLCAQLGDRHRAESEIAQALQLSPHDANTLWTAALTYEILGRRDLTLGLVTAFPAELLADFSRRPEVEALRTDPRFTRLLLSQQTK